MTPTGRRRTGAVLPTTFQPRRSDDDLDRGCRRRCARIDGASRGEPVFRARARACGAVRDGRGEHRRLAGHRPARRAACDRPAAHVSGAAHVRVRRHPRRVHDLFEFHARHVHARPRRRSHACLLERRRAGCAWSRAGLVGLSRGIADCRLMIPPMHPWHDTPVDETEIATSFPVIIEIPKGSTNKYELDKVTGLLKLERGLYSSVHYPADYGFIPRTYCGDGDPLDVLVLGQEPVYPLTIVDARAVGVMRMRDVKGTDDKIVAVSVGDPWFAGVNDIKELQPHRLREIQQFLRDYKSLEGKIARVGPLEGSRKAHRVIRDAVALYRDEIYPSLGV